MAKPGPNDRCACGSGKKYKKCCREVTETLVAAAACHGRADIPQAAALYTRVLETNASQPDALHGLGVIAYELKDYSAAQGFLRKAAEEKPGSATIHYSLALTLQAAGELEEAANSYARALAIEPHFAQSLLRLGVTLYTLGRLEDAAACFVRTVQLEDVPTLVDAHNNLGVIHQNQSRWEEAAACFRQAITLNPNFAEGHNNLGAVLRSLGQTEEAIPELQRAVELKADYTLAHYNLGLSWKTLDRREEAIAAFAEAVRLDPDNQQAGYFLHALRGDVTPSVTPAGLVANLFDGYADNFDQHLQGSLGYCTPTLLREAFDESGGGGPVDILDLGCGTGLAGEAFRNVGGRLCGADLSSRMVEKARTRGIYQELHVEDILTTLGREQASFGVVLAADVFVYIGDLSPIFAAVGQTLRPGGRFLFSVETVEGETYVLSPAGRFQHPRAYIQSLADRHGFSQVSMRGEVPLRKERGEAVRGDIYVLQQRAGN